MIDRAGPFLARRSLTALIVSTFVVSAIAGMFIVGERTSASGDLIVTGGTYVIQDLHQYVDGNVEVRSGGTLKIIDGTLSVISNFDQRFTVTVDAGGTLILDHGVLTTHLDQINPWAELELNVMNGGVVIATNGSELKFPGGITLTNGAEMELRDSVITSLDPDVVSLYVVGSAGLITLDSANDGPEMDITDSTFKLFDSVIDAMPEYPTDLMPAGNLTLNGDSTLLSVNSHIGVDFGPAFDAADWRLHNVLVVNDLSQAYLYGTTFDEYEGLLADRAPAVAVSGVTTSPATPASKGASDDTGQNLASLASVDSLAYIVDSGETMEIASWDPGALLDTTSISSASIVATYSVDPAYNDPTPSRLEWRANAGTYASTTIQPLATDAPGTTATYELPVATISDVGDVRNMDVRFVNGATVGSVQFDALWIVFTVGGDAYVYRWLNTTVGDEYGVPIPGATISATFTGGTELEGQEAFYYTADGVSTAPDVDVLDYMGETAGTYKTAKADGKAVIPYLTDIIVSDGSSNSLFVGSYAVTGTTEPPLDEYSSTESFSFPAYPAMEEGDTSGDLTVEIMGISVPSPDYSRWLVVPLSESETTLTIEDMTYYHAGDVIVASDGELIVRNAEFLLVQDFPNQRTIYVDGNGHLLFESCLIESDLPIDIVVQGHGTLEIVDSEMHGVSIVANEDATVILDGTDGTDGDITTSWNSRAHISIFDCNFTETPVLSGYSVGGFTNTSVPSIVVEDDALGLVYRWIHVYVLDGNAKPLPGVDVYARFFVNDTHWTSTVSDSAGVARLNCLGTILTSEGSTFIGNYKVNATYHYGGASYESDQQVSVGVMPYTEPLWKNATYTTLTISAALPNLVISQTGAISSDPVYPLNGEVTTITALVRNTGISVAYNVQVRFFDEGVLFATVTVPSIAPHPTEATAVEATWTADKPLYPTAHTIRVEVDPDDLINEVDDTPAIGYGTVYVQNLPDLVASPDFNMYTVPSEPVLDSECRLVANIYNFGDNTAYNVPVAFYNASIDLIGPENFIGEYIISSLAAPPLTNFIAAWVTWIPESTGAHTISVLVNEDHTVPEISYNNNNASFEIEVYDYPDLALSDIEFEGPTTVASDQTVIVSATLTNDEIAPVTDPVVGLFIDGVAIDYAVVDGTFVAGSGSGLVEFSFKAPFVTETTDFEISLIANPNQTFLEQTRDNNEVSGTLTVTDVRPDLQLTDAGMYVTYNDANVTGQMWGRTVHVVIEVENLGAGSVSNAVLLWGVMQPGTVMNYTFDDVTLGIMAPGNLTVLTQDWKINFTNPGSYMIWAIVDPLDSTNESNEANNYAETAFEVQELAIIFDIQTTDNEYEAGAAVITTIQVWYEDDSSPVVGLNVTMALYDSSGVAVQNTQTSRLTGTDGDIAGVMIDTDEDLVTGQYYIGLTIHGEEYSSGDTFTITGEEAAEGIPLLIWIIVIVVIIAVVVGFTAYTYVYGLGKLVECGECGAFIPAASKRCPKCGVEFEAGTMKCSECGAWVPSSASECPNCGVKFVGEPGEGELDYLEKMRAEYDAMVDEYREMAKADLGKKFSEKRFEEWWMAQPTYVSFDDWLAKEEARRKEGPVPCSVCGTLNPREATVCHKCGTIFSREGEQPPGQMPPAGLSEEDMGPMPEERAPPAERRPPEGGAGAAGVPKTVVRRPIDRKVVPKKIIRRPIDKEDEGSG